MQQQGCSLPSPDHNQTIIDMAATMIAGFDSLIGSKKCEPRESPMDITRSYNVSRPSWVACSRANSVNVASFVLCGCPIVAKTAIPACGAAGMTDIAIRFWGLLALSRNQKLLPHFGEAGTAVFAVEEIEYGWHDRHLSFDRHHRFPRYHLSWDARRDLDHSPSCFNFAIWEKWLYRSRTIRSNSMANGR